MRKEEVQLFVPFLVLSLGFGMVGGVARGSRGVGGSGFIPRAPRGTGFAGTRAGGLGLMKKMPGLICGVRPLDILGKMGSGINNGC